MEMAMEPREPPRKISEVIPALEGHEVDFCFCHGKLWCQIDGMMLAKPDEIKELARGVYSFRELIQLFEKMRAGERGTL